MAAQEQQSGTTDQAEAEASIDAPSSTQQTAARALHDDALATPDTDTAQSAFGQALDFLLLGGPAIWAIGVLSVLAAAVIFWKIWRLSLMGAWSKGKARFALDAASAGDPAAALSIVKDRAGIRSRLVETALLARAAFPQAEAREETTRVAKGLLAEARSGLRVLELITTIAPLLGLLGTVMGMIAAFQSLQEAGAGADPSALAGGIWEALLTTAAGMAVAIPVSAALTWFESVIDRIRLDLEDAATRIFIAPDVPDTLPDGGR